MGIGAQAARDLIIAVKAAHPRKPVQRAQIEDAMNILQAKLAALDIQIGQAKADFATSKQAQFNDFVDALPDVGDPLP